MRFRQLLLLAAATWLPADVGVRAFRLPTVRCASRICAVPAAQALVMQEEPAPLPPPPPPPPPPPAPDLFIPILVGVSFGGYGLILLYDVLTNGFCAPFLQLGRCAPSDLSGW